MPQVGDILVYIPAGHASSSLNTSAASAAAVGGSTTYVASASAAAVLTRKRGDAGGGGGGGGSRRLRGETVPAPTPAPPATPLAPSTPFVAMASWPAVLVRVEAATPDFPSSPAEAAEARVMGDWWMGRAGV